MLKLNRLSSQIFLNTNLALKNIDLDDLEYYDDDSDSEGEEIDADFSMINPDLIDFDLDDGNDDIGVPVTSTSVIDNQSIPHELFYEMCSKLNQGQLELFNFITKYAYEWQLADKNDLINLIHFISF